MVRSTLLALALLLAAAPAPAVALPPGTVEAWLDARADAFFRASDPDGAFRRDTSGDRVIAYGQAFAAAGLVRSGGRRSEPALLERAAATLGDLRRTGPVRDPFRLLGTGLALDALSRVPDAPGGLTDEGAALRAWLSHWETGVATLEPHDATCYERPPCYNNWRLVEAAGLALALRAGVPFTDGGALAGREGARRRIVETLRTAHRHAGPPTARGGRVLSDPPQNPLAYHAFSAALLALIHEATPAVEPTVARRLLASSVRYLVEMAAPDGAVAYAGRSQEQAWTLAASSLACRVAAPLLRPEEQGACARLDDLAAIRLLTAHRTLPSGIVAITPGERGEADALAGVDAYSGLRLYGALTQALLEKTLDHPAPPGLGPLVSDLQDAAAVDVEGSGVAWVRGDRVWAAVLVGDRAPDARATSGLVALRVFSPRTGWRSPIAGRPVRGPGVWWGPQPRIGGRWARLRLERAVRGPGPVLVTTGSWVVGGRTAARARLVFRPAGGALRITASVPPGAPVRWAEFLAATASAGTAVVGGAGAPRLASGYPTALTPDGRRHEWRLASGRRGEVTAVIRDR